MEFTGWFVQDLVVYDGKDNGFCEAIGTPLLKKDKKTIISWVNVTCLRSAKRT